MSARLLLERRPRPAAQRTEDAPSSVKSAVPDLADALLSPSAGEPLRDDTRAYLEPRLGHSLSNVRVHADGRADALVRSVQAGCAAVVRRRSPGQVARDPLTSLRAGQQAMCRLV